jgi:hypothetical protein
MPLVKITIKTLVLKKKKCQIGKHLNYIEKFNFLQELKNYAEEKFLTL